MLSISQANSLGKIRTRCVACRDISSPNRKAFERLRMERSLQHARSVLAPSSRPVTTMWAMARNRNGSRAKRKTTKKFSSLGRALARAPVKLLNFAGARVGFCRPIWSLFWPCRSFSLPVLRSSHRVQSIPHFSRSLKFG